MSAAASASTINIIAYHIIQCTLAILDLAYSNLIYSNLLIMIMTMMHELRRCDSQFTQTTQVHQTHSRGAVRYDYLRPLLSSHDMHGYHWLASNCCLITFSIFLCSSKWFLRVGSRTPPGGISQESLTCSLNAMLALETGSGVAGVSCDRLGELYLIANPSESSQCNVVRCCVVWPNGRHIFQRGAFAGIIVIMQKIEVLSICLRDEMI